MKFWRIANIYWIVCITYFSYKLNIYDFGTTQIDSGVPHAISAFVMICAVVMILELQIAWYMYLKYRDQDAVKKIKLHHKK